MHDIYKQRAENAGQHPKTLALLRVFPAARDEETHTRAVVVLILIAVFATWVSSNKTTWLTAQTICSSNIFTPIIPRKIPGRSGLTGWGYICRVHSSKSRIYFNHFIKPGQSSIHFVQQAPRSGPAELSRRGPFTAEPFYAEVQSRFGDKLLRKNWTGLCPIRTEFCPKRVN